MRTEQYRAACQSIRAEIFARYSAELSRSNIVRRIFVRLKMQWEIYRRSEEIAPAKGLYLQR